MFRSADGARRASDERGYLLLRPVMFFSSATAPSRSGQQSCADLGDIIRVFRGIALALCRPVEDE
eukprot:m.179942 g.179942  ORF g.179942 m.179942 type:complete len:65 (+) comp53434_c0_seq3:3566-3760(+)